MRALWFVTGLFLVATSVIGYAEEIATTYHGMIKSIRGTELVLMTRDGHEKTVRLSKETRVFVGGRVSPSNRILPNSIVRIAVIDGSRCLQVVVEEGPK